MGSVNYGEPDGVAVEPAVITAVATSGTVDGRPLVTVTWRGLDVPVPYLPPATPYSAAAVGSTVAVLVQGAELLLLGPVWGQPLSTA